MMKSTAGPYNEQQQSRNIILHHHRGEQRSLVVAGIAAVRSMEYTTAVRFTIPAGKPRPTHAILFSNWENQAGKK